MGRLIYSISLDGFLVKLRSNGILTIVKDKKTKDYLWYFDIITGQLWIPRRSYFTKIVKQFVKHNCRDDRYEWKAESESGKQVGVKTTDTNTATRAKVHTKTS